MSTTTVGVTEDRRERYRAFMRRFNPVAPPEIDLKEGRVVDDSARSLYKSLAARADLEPGSQQLVVGGIGSGKTTELLLARQVLETNGHSLPIFVDVTQKTDISMLSHGALLASLGIELLEVPEVQTLPGLEYTRSAIRTFAYGKIRWAPRGQLYNEGYFDEHDHEEPCDPMDEHIPVTEVRRKLHPPTRLPPIVRELRDVLGPLDHLLQGVRDSGREAVILFDGLDRARQAEKFYELVSQDFQALRTLNVSVLAAAPLSVLGTAVADSFDRVRHLATADPKKGDFLASVMLRREAMQLMSSACSDELCRLSGGVVRDLISLTRDAAEAAYIAGEETVEKVHVETAADSMGYAYYLGLGPAQVKILARLRDHGVFSVGTPETLGLVLDRRVLEYEGPPPRYEVHPTLAPLLESK